MVAASPEAGLAPKQVREQVLAAIGGKLSVPQVGVGRKLAMVIVLAVLLVMPLFYAAVIGGLAYGMIWLATSSFGASLAPALLWTIEVAGLVVLVALMKPLVEPQRATVAVFSLDSSQETLLYDWIRRICEQIDAPPPTSIAVECSTGIAAGSRRGSKLTLGLPLVACLSVEHLAGLIAGELALRRRRAGRGMMSWIRGINGWLWRSVYGQSRFDQWLALVAERRHLHGAKLLLPLAGAKYVARTVLFVPMFIANTIAAAVVRQAELDADRIVARLVGRKAFGLLVERIELIAFEWEGVLAELDFLHREQQLPNNLPQQLAIRMRDVTPELRIALRETVNKPEERPFDSRATSSERVAAVAGEPAEGVLKCSLPAQSLIVAFDELARKMTWDYYVRRFGAQYLKTAVQPVGRR